MRPTGESLMLDTAPNSATEHRAVVSWAGQGQPIVLALYGPEGEMLMPLSPTRAFELAQELIEPAVLSIKVKQWGSAE